MPTTPTKTEVANKLKTKQTKIVLVRPKKSQSWLDLDPTLDDSNSEIRNDDENIKNVCEVGLDKQECGENEICQPSGSKSRSGTCICKDGFTKDANNLCIIKGNVFFQFLRKSNTCILLFFFENFFFFLF